MSSPIFELPKDTHVSEDLIGRLYRQAFDDLLAQAEEQYNRLGRPAGLELQIWIEPSELGSTTIRLSGRFIPTTDTQYPNPTS